MMARISICPGGSKIFQKRAAFGCHWISSLASASSFLGAGVFVSAKELVAALKAGKNPPDIQFIHLSSSQESFSKEHIPSALRFPAELSSLQLKTKPGSCSVLSRYQLMEALKGAQVKNPGAVICYDDGSGFLAARLWWVLRLYGAYPPEIIRILNGGLPAWRNASSVVQAELPKIEGSGSLVLMEEMREIVQHNLNGSGENTLILDVRPIAEWLGQESRGNSFIGRIPTSKHFDLDRLMSHGKFPDASLVLEEVSSLGANPCRPIVVLCQMGVRASAAAALLESAGFQKVRIYDGSMFEWNNIANLPRET